MNAEQYELAEYLYSRLSEYTTTLSDSMYPLRDAYEASINYTADNGRTDTAITRSWEELQRIERRLNRAITQLETMLENQCQHIAKD